MGRSRAFRSPLAGFGGLVALATGVSNTRFSPLLSATGIRIGPLRRIGYSRARAAASFIRTDSLPPGASAGADHHRRNKLRRRRPGETIVSSARMPGDSENATTPAPTVVRLTGETCPVGCLHFGEDRVSDDYRHRGGDRRGRVFQGAPGARMVRPKEVFRTDEADREPCQATPHCKHRAENAHRLASPTGRAGGKCKPPGERREQEHAHEVGLVTLSGVVELKAQEQEDEQSGPGEDQQRTRKRPERFRAPSCAATEARRRTAGSGSSRGPHR